MADNNTIVIYKPVGMTPLEAVQEYKRMNPETRAQKISYAGRLDPMAEGLLLLLVGEENKKRKEYENQDKKYQAEIGLGITTDSFDGLGMILEINLGGKISKESVQKCLSTFVGKKNQTYPPYSSRTVQGKSLFCWAREKKLSQITIPKKEIEIFSIDVLDCSVVQARDLAGVVKKKISTVTGDFRQKTILQRWDRFIEQQGQMPVSILRIDVHCSSGAYIRRLASDIGEQLGCGAFLVSLIRTHIGEIGQEDAIRIKTPAQR